MWITDNNMLHRKFEFKDFSNAFAFMTRVAFVAEQMNHHPNWSNVWNQVTINLQTHDAQNTITEKDKELATKIDKIYADFL